MLCGRSRTSEPWEPLLKPFLNCQPTIHPLGSWAFWVNEGRKSGPGLVQLLQLVHGGPHYRDTLVSGTGWIEESNKWGITEKSQEHKSKDCPSDFFFFWMTCKSSVLFLSDTFIPLSIGAMAIGQTKCISPPNDLYMPQFFPNMLILQLNSHRVHFVFFWVCEDTAVTHPFTATHICYIVCSEASPHSMELPLIDRAFWKRRYRNLASRTPIFYISISLPHNWAPLHHCTILFWYTSLPHPAFYGQPPWLSSLSLPDSIFWNFMVLHSLVDILSSCCDLKARAFWKL